MILFRLFLLWLALSLSLTAHQVEQHFLKVFLEDDHLLGRLEMDVGYTLPEMRSNEDETIPTLEWLNNLNEAQKERILVEGEKYLQAVLGFTLEGEDLALTITFDKWGTDWPIFFDQRLDTPARMVWEVRHEYQDRNGLLELHWKESEDGPSLALATVSNGRELDLITVDQGRFHTLAQVSASTGQTTQAVTNRFSIFGWLKSGFEHVIPLGLDHILFILGLFFLSPKWKDLLTQSLIFTIAHTITLGLTVTKIIPVNPGIIEPLIALSIAYVAIENLFLKELKPWRLFFIFALGLLHGMGFGSVMSALPVESSSLVIPLIGFNLGVEIAQITILALALGATFWFQQRKEYQWLRIAASLAIAATGLFWTVERIWFS